MRRYPVTVILLTLVLILSSIMLAGIVIYPKEEGVVCTICVPKVNPYMHVVDVIDLPSTSMATVSRHVTLLRKPVSEHFWWGLSSSEPFKLWDIKVKGGNILLNETIEAIISENDEYSYNFTKIPLLNFSKFTVEFSTDSIIKESKHPFHSSFWYPFDQYKISYTINSYREPTIYTGRFILPYNTKPISDLVGIQKTRLGNYYFHSKISYLSVFSSERAIAISEDRTIFSGVEGGIDVSFIIGRPAFPSIYLFAILLVFSVITAFAINYKKFGISGTFFALIIAVQSITSLIPLARPPTITFFDIMPFIVVIISVLIYSIRIFRKMFHKSKEFT